MSEVMSMDKSISFIKDSMKDDGSFSCYLSTKRDLASSLESPKEIGSTLIVLELLHKYLGEEFVEQMLHYIIGQRDDDGTFHFFEDKKLLPNDTDTTSRGLSTLLDMGRITKNEAHIQSSKIANNVDNSGLIQTYYNEYNREREIDPTAILNIIRFLIKGNVDTDEYGNSYDYIIDLIDKKGFENPGRYYTSPRLFLYFLQRLGEVDHQMKAKLENIIGNHDVPVSGVIDKACMITIKKELGIDSHKDEISLAEDMREDGSFAFDSIYKYGSKNLFFGSHVIATSFAIHSLLKDKKI